MAGIQWGGIHAKSHGSQEAKAVLRHNDKDQRLRYSHSNPDINTELTHLNYSFYGKSYYEKVQE